MAQKKFKPGEWVVTPYMEDDAPDYFGTLWAAEFRGAARGRRGYAKVRFVDGCECNFPVKDMLSFDLVMSRMEDVSVIKAMYREGKTDLWHDCNLLSFDSDSRSFQILHPATHKKSWMEISDLDLCFGDAAVGIKYSSGELRKIVILILCTTSLNFKIQNCT